MIRADTHRTLLLPCGPVHSMLRNQRWCVVLPRRLTVVASMTVLSRSRSQSYSESLDEIKLFRINPAAEKEAKHARILAGIEAAGGILRPREFLDDEIK